MTAIERLELVRDIRARDLALAEADLLEAEGSVDFAAWKRAEAAGDREASLRHWARGMARVHLRDGSEVGEHKREEILAAMEQLRAESATCDDGACEVCEPARAKEAP